MALDRIGFLLKHAYLAYEALAASRYESLGATARECGILGHVQALDGPSQLELATELGVDRTTMAQLLDTLERRDLISRAPLPVDRRRNEVSLTELGRELLDREATVRSDVEREFLSALDSDAQSVFRAALLAINDQARASTPN